MGMFTQVSGDSQVNDLENEGIDISAAVTEYKMDSVDGWLVDLAKLPKDCKVIRFENHY